MMRRYGGNQEARIQYLESRVRQHYVDVQRLWKRIPQGMDAFGRDVMQPQIPDPSNEPLSGGPGGQPGTGGTQRCSRGAYYYQQTRFPQRVRSTPFLRSNQVWETPSAAAGPTDGAGATCTMPPGAENRSRALVSDEYDFAIPVDAEILRVDADVVWKCERIGAAGGTVIPFICESQAGAEADGAQFGPWFHRNGVRFGGAGSVNLTFSTRAFQYAPGVTETYRHGFHTVAEQLNSPGAYYFGVPQPLTAAEVNSSGFGWMLAFHGQTFGTGTFRIGIDSIAITVDYRIFHQTGCTGETFGA